MIAQIRLLAALSTFCNPMSIPDMPLGMNCRGQVNGEPVKGAMWRRDTVEQYRELADPTLLVEDGVYWLFPSCGAAWTSTDGATWTHIPVEPPGIGYAPTVVKHEGRFYATGSAAPILVADRLAGPWRKAADIHLPAGSPLLADPMLFSENGVLYFYWGCTPKGGIWGGVIDPETGVVTEAKELVKAEPDKYPWMRVGYDPKVSWMEGAWMVKIGNRYALTYSASGTENKTYAMGVAYGDSPLGPFTVDPANPFLRKTTGLVTGTGHGSIVKGLDGRWRVIYCVAVGARHGFERLIGLDILNVDDSAGKILGTVPTETPQPLMGTGPQGGTVPAWRVLGNCGGFDLKTVQNGMVFTAQLGTDPTQAPGTVPSVRSFRVIWREQGLDVERGVKSGPIRYVVEAQKGDLWSVIYDAGDNQTDLLVDYRELTGPVPASTVRLRVIGAPLGITPQLVDFTVFGL